MRKLSKLAGSALMMALLWTGVGSVQAQDYRAILADPERPDAERALDEARKPDQVLPFYGVKAGDKVADIFAARGYYTAILSHVVGPQGVVYSVNPNARPEWTDRYKKPQFANVRAIDGSLDKVTLPQDGSLDFVLIHLNYHDLTPEVRTAMNKRILASLKQGGVYGVVDHSAQDGTGNEAAKTLHRIDKALVIREATAAGFVLAAEGQMLRRPDDPRDFNVNKERGKDDRFVLRFERPRR